MRELEAEFGFTLDVCATAESAKCDRYFTREDNGLNQPWDGVVWCNPPFDDIASWVAKSWLELLSGTTDTIVVLVPAWTDRAWWAEQVEPYRDTIGSPLKSRFLKGRVRFGQPGDQNGEHAGQPSFWCCLLIFQAGGNK